MACTVAREPGVLIELSDSNGGTDDRGLVFVEIGSIAVDSSNTTEAKETPDLPVAAASSIEPLIQKLSNQIYHIIDISSLGKLVFIDKQSWVSSIQLHTIDQKQLSYSRHFFIPYGWYSGVRDVVCAAVRRNLLFARNDNVVIVKNGLDHTEMIVA